jgi:hypothetical protein
MARRVDTVKAVTWAQWRWVAVSVGLARHGCRMTRQPVGRSYGQRMSYEALWVVTFTPDWDQTHRVRAAGPFPAVEAAEEFARTLRESWPAEDNPEIEVVQIESAEPISELIDGDR